MFEGKQGVFEEAAALLRRGDEELALLALASALREAAGLMIGRWIAFASLDGYRRAFEEVINALEARGIMSSVRFHSSPKLEVGRS